MAVTEGDLVPAFNLPLDNGFSISNENLKGQAYVLFLYPKDNTSGCTKEAIGFSEKKTEFEQLGVRLIGLSKDSINSHQSFRKKQELTTDLASDEETVLIQALGSWAEKSMYGKKYMGTDRSTFLVGEDGRIINIWRKVKVPGHVEAVLKAAQEHAGGMA